MTSYLLFIYPVLLFTQSIGSVYAKAEQRATNASVQGYTEAL